MTDKQLQSRSCVRSYVDFSKLTSLQQNLAADQETLQETAQLFAILGDATRLRILSALREGDELCVCDLADILQMQVSAVSHQLRRLRDRGLVQNRREGPTIYYSLRVGESFRQALKFMESFLREPVG